MLPEQFIELTDIPRRVDDEARVLTAVFKHFNLDCLYKPYLNHGREEYCEKFGKDFNSYARDQIDNERRHTIIAGDINVAPTRMDETSNSNPEGPGSTAMERAQHAELLKCGFTDAWRQLHKTERKYTAASNIAEWKISKTNNKAEIVEKRIDVVLVSKGVKILSAEIDDSTRTFTDHSAVIVTLDVSPSVKRKPNSNSKKKNAAHRKRAQLSNLNAVMADDGVKTVTFSDDVITSDSDSSDSDNDDEFPFGAIENC
jgi:exonuclease III